MASSKRKRFIAGAVCPGCGVEDKVFVVTEESGAYRGCSQCDFQERLEDVPPDPDVQVVRFPESD
jgi:uncharacterized metal-binding protein (TIGR02443 family)